MTDFLHDPNFPDRPSHADFWRLSSVVTQSDGEATEGGRSAQDIAAEVVDPDSLTYMALQRSLRAMSHARSSGMLRGLFAAVAGRPGDTDDEQDSIALLAALWTDGFVAGARFEQEGGHRD